MLTSSGPCAQAAGGAADNGALTHADGHNDSEEVRP